MMAGWTGNDDHFFDAGDPRQHHGVQNGREQRGAAAGHVSANAADRPHHLGQHSRRGGGHEAALGFLAVKLFQPLAGDAQRLAQVRIHIVVGFAPLALGHLVGGVFVEGQAPLVERRLAALDDVGDDAADRLFGANRLTEELGNGALQPLAQLEP